MFVRAGFRHFGRGGFATTPRAETVGFEPTEEVAPLTALAGPRTRPNYATSPRLGRGYLSASSRSKAAPQRLSAPTGPPGQLLLERPRLVGQDARRGQPDRDADDDEDRLHTRRHGHLEVA